MAGQAEMTKLLAGADAPAETEAEKEVVKEADDLAAAVEGVAISGDAEKSPEPEEASA